MRHMMLRRLLLLLLLLLMVMVVTLLIVTCRMRRAHKCAWCLARLKQTVPRFVVRISRIGRRLLAGRWPLAQLCHQTLVLLIDLGLGIIIAALGPATLLRPAILRYVSRSTTNRAQNIVGDVRLVRTQPALVIGGAAVRTAGTIGLAQRAV